MRPCKMLSALVLFWLCAAAAPAGEPGATVVPFAGSWGDPGFTVTYSGPDGLEVVHSLPSVSLTPVSLRGVEYMQVTVPGAMLPTDPGAPNLPGGGRYLAVPDGAKVEVEVLDSRTHLLEGIRVLPSARLPFDIEREAPLPEEDPAIYARDAEWPARPVTLSPPATLRGVGARILGVTPFAYNPVTRQLVVYTDLRIRVTFRDGRGTFGEERLRSRHWDPLLARQLLNFDLLPAVDYSSRDYSGRDGVEYMIIVPDSADFITWGQTIADYRILQGISSQVYTVTQVGGNTTAAIEAFINNAYNNWSTAPVAFLLLGDYVASGAAGGITSPSFAHPYSGTYITDNAYADVTGDHLPDLAAARITARNAAELSLMINKFLDYEQDPPTAANFYENPLVACGFQTERWFQLCSEIVEGFLALELGKTPVRQYNIYYGSPSPGDPWSSNPNTPLVVNYFGPSGLGYIPATLPSINWSSGSVAGINAAINAGAFIVQHRDHGAEDGWGEPAYTTSSLTGLTNSMLPWVFSINCLTGRFDYSTEVFAERFHRMAGGALGLTAATQVSYSFVNDTYIFGLYDSLWPEFMPAYPAVGRAVGPEDLRPAFADINGKYYLQASSWPYNPEDKAITYDLFHTLGDAFVTLFSEVPATMTVTHNPVLFAMTPFFTVTAPAGSLIALTRDGQILGTADGTGAPVNVIIPGQLPGPPAVTVTVTQTNHYRYSAEVLVLPQEGPFVSYQSHLLDDDGSGYSSGNGDGIATPGETIELQLNLKNFGVETAYGVAATVSSSSPHVQLLDATAAYGNVSPDQTKANLDALVFQVLPTCPHGEIVNFQVSATDGADVWDSPFSITVLAAQIAVAGQTVVDSPYGNGDGNADMGERPYIELSLENVGAVDAEGVTATLTADQPEYVTVLDGQASFADLLAGASGTSLAPHLRILIDLDTPCGTLLTFAVQVISDQGSSAGTLAIQVGGTALIFQDTIESGVGGWTHSAGQGTDDWAIITSSYAHSPTHVWRSTDASTVKDDYLVSPQLALTELSQLSFWHRFSMETGYDGCVIEINTGGALWSDLGSHITQGTYTHTISTSYSCPIGGRQAWSGTNGATATQVVVDLSAYAGTTSRIRFRLATDSSVSGDGWYIDDVDVTGAECEPYSGGPVDTVAVGITCTPPSGTLPFAVNLSSGIENLSAENRRMAGRVSLVLGGGMSFGNYRSGYVNLGPYAVFSTAWNQNFPAYGSLLGNNIFTLSGMDVTPSPYNQPPYTPSGDTDVAGCTVTATAP